MSGPDQRPERGPEHRHENDPTGNGMVNHGPEKTPHTDPDRPHAGSAGPEPDERDAGPGAGASVDATATAGSGAEDGTQSRADADAKSGSGSGPDAADAAAKSDPKPRPGAAAGKAAKSGLGADDAPGAPDDDVLATLTDLFAADRSAPTADELDEVALRRMLQGAVRDISPSEGTLDHLHRAVPARRARRRQAVVGAAAAALLIGTAVPAFVHVAASDGQTTASPAIAGHGEQAQGGNGDESGPEEPGRRTVQPTERESEGGVGEADPDPSPSEGRGGDPEGAEKDEEPDSPRVDFASLPVCDPSQLGVASAGTDAPGADGTVYGSFKIANISAKECTVSSNGTVGVTALGAADPLKIGVVQHAAGDAAPGLPDPSQEPGTVALKPAMAYEVKFAWVPTDTCPTTGPSPTPTPSADGAGGSVGEGSDQSGVEAQWLQEDGGGTAEGSVAVTHTPETGAPTAETKIPNACSGTIYRTGVLATS
ncbi:hypothetical protein [Streptomyces sp. SM13]|uniref:hypothetical protein n=1 Tax=Streptomyces sp. SM13 TaxID=1983803 RepID=UPI0015E1A099|nr:hypothetical protein [Streptomyces sp. SM13]